MLGLAAAIVAGGAVATPPVAAQGRSADTARVRAPGDTTLPRPLTPFDSARNAQAEQGADSVLNVELLGRLEFKGEQTRNDRCYANQLFSATFRCQANLTPQLDFQFSLNSSGTIANRVKVNVDYDSQREFDGSNLISLAYEGKPGEYLQRLEVGNVSFSPPPSRFLTSGIPSGNYGVQAIGQFGPLRINAIAAQQKGNVVKGQVFTIGAHTTAVQDRSIDDYQIEPRRFFFTVDPQVFGARYPNIDILDPQQMSDLALSLPDTVRPSRVFLYRLLIGGQPPNPNGPRFTLLEDSTSRAGPGVRAAARGGRLLHRSLAAVGGAGPAAAAEQRAPRGGLHAPRERARYHHRAARRHARPRVQPVPPAVRASGVGPARDARPADVQARDPLRLPAGRRRDPARDGLHPHGHRHRQRPGEAAGPVDHVPAALRHGAEDQQRRVRRREQALAEAARPELPHRLADGLRSVKTDPRRLRRLSLAGALLAPRPRAAGDGRLQRHDLPHAVRVPVLAAASAGVLPAQRPLRDAVHGGHRGDRAGLGADPPRERAPHRGRAPAHPRRRLHHRLRPGPRAAPHRGHAQPGGAEGDGAVRGEPAVRERPDVHPRAHLPMDAAVRLPRLHGASRRASGPRSPARRWATSRRAPSWPA